MGLASLLTKVADITLSKAGRTVLTSLGVGLVSSAVSLSMLQQYISFLQLRYGLIGDLAGLLALADFPLGMSIVLSAVTVKITLKAKNVTLGAKS